jgi:nudix-type nucleoside diphosphatase (YffH/AdpP family)
MTPPSDIQARAAPEKRADRASIAGNEAVLRGWVSVYRLHLQMPDGVVVERHIEDHGPGVAVLPYDPDRRVALLITQPRAPVLLAGEGDVLEVIAGRLDGADPAERAREEAREEGGVELGRLDPIVHLWSMPSISTERLHLYLAPYSAEARVSAGGGCKDEHENITVLELALADLAAAAAAGRLADAKTLILVQTLQLRRPELFD